MRTKALKNISVYVFAVILISPLLTDSVFAAKGGGRNKAPVINNQYFNVDENSASGTAVGIVTASDPNGDSLSFSITSGNSDGAFLSMQEVVRLALPTLLCWIMKLSPSLVSPSG